MHSSPASDEGPKEGEAGEGGTVYNRGAIHCSPSTSNDLVSPPLLCPSTASFHGDDPMSKTMEPVFEQGYDEDALSAVGVRLVFILLYSLVFLLGLTGNTLVVFVVARRRKMHTVFNIFLANLAISDILMCLLAVPFTPISVLHSWIFGETICHIVPMTLGVTVYVSTLTSTVIALNRYVVIVHPYRPKMRPVCCFPLILFIWTLSILVSLPLAIYQKVSWNQLDGSYFCHEDWPHQTSKQFFTVGNFVLQFLVPCSIIVFCYVNVSVTLAVRCRTTIGSGRANPDREVLRNRRTTRMLIAMVSIFVCCWMPLNAFFVLIDYYVLQAWRYFYGAFLLAHLIAMSSTVYNPFLYAWMNNGFRKEFEHVLPCFFRRRTSLKPRRLADDPILAS